MTLRIRSAIILGLFIAAGVFILFIFVRQLNLLSYSRLEERRADEEIRRARALLLDELDAVGALADALVHRYSVEAGYAAGPQPAWEGDLPGIGHGRAGFVAVVNATGEQIAPAPPTGFAAVGIAPELLREIATREAMARRGWGATGTTGFLMLAQGPTAVALRPLPAPAGTLSPGTLIAGWLFRERDLARIRRILRNDVQLLPFDVLRATGELAQVRKRLTTANPTLTVAIDERTIGAYALVEDLRQRPALLLRLESPREIVAQGMLTMRYLLLGLSVIGGVLVVVTLLVLERFVISLETFKAEIISNVASGLVTFRPDGTVTLINPAALQILGIVPPPADARLEEVVGAPFAAVMLRTLRDGTALSATHEIVLADAAGPERVFGYTVSRMSPDPRLGPQGIALFRDLTESKKLEADLQRFNRLVSLGEVSAQMGHELRNPLTAMYSIMQFLARDLAGEAREMGQLVLANMERMEGILKRMSLLTREASTERVRFDLCDLLGQLLRFLDARLREGRIAVRPELPPSPVWIDGDPSQLYQALLNVLINAIQAMQAMPDGGTLEIALAPLPSSTPPRAAITIADSGPGIAPGTAERILDPFFTTKTQGSGLGLSIADRVCRDHGGTLRFENRPGGGALFTVELPVAPPAAAGVQ